MTQDETFEFQGKRWRKNTGTLQGNEEWFTAVEVKPTKPDALERLEAAVLDAHKPPYTVEINGDIKGELHIARATVQAALEIMRADLAEVAKQDTEAMMRLEARIAKLEPGSERSTQIQIILSGVRR